jgi:hypothetical protein
MTKGAVSCSITIGEIPRGNAPVIIHQQLKAKRVRITKDSRTIFVDGNDYNDSLSKSTSKPTRKELYPPTPHPTNWEGLPTV